MVPFAQKLEQIGYPVLRAGRVSTLQVNLGWRCNQACHHCHLTAGPGRPEQMELATVEAVIAVVARWALPVVDLTGGSPEINPHFEYLVDRLHRLVTHLLVRCNLTILLEPSREHLPEFFRDHGVELVCSLPYFLADPVDRLRGPGVFDKSLEALRRLNRVGYGAPGSELQLHLMYNPGGAYLPPEQGALEDRFQRELQDRHGITFNRLYTMLNMPIGRFKGYLEGSGNYERYLGKLEASFNPATVTGLMCRSLLSVSWEGRLFDCDFNQALNLPLAADLPQTIWEFDLPSLEDRIIQLDDHCYGCTAAAGSSCGGNLVGN